MSSWYFVKDGQRNGPIGREELAARIADGTVDGDTLVWRAGMDAWVRACLVPDLGVPPLVPPPKLPTETPPTWERVPEQPRAAAAGAQASAARGLVYGDFWTRFAAKIIDGVILAGIGQGVEWAVTKWVFEGPLPMPPDWAGFLRGMLWLVSINTIIALIYSVYFQLLHEGTPGKRLLGLRVVRADGSRLSGWRAAARYGAEQLSGMTFLVGYVMAAFDDEKRALHDFICDTRVVKGERDVAQDGARPGARQDDLSGYRRE